jgi:hypothetical protein
MKLSGKLAIGGAYFLPNIEREPHPFNLREIYQIDKNSRFMTFPLAKK